MEGEPDRSRLVQCSYAQVTDDIMRKFARLRNEVQRLQQELAGKEQELAEKEQELTTKEQEVAGKEQELAEKEQELVEQKESTQLLTIAVECYKGWLDNRGGDRHGIFTVENMRYGDDCVDWPTLEELADEMKQAKKLESTGTYITETYC